MNAIRWVGGVGGVESSVVLNEYSNGSSLSTDHKGCWDGCILGTCVIRYLHYTGFADGTLSEVNVKPI